MTLDRESLDRLRHDVRTPLAVIVGFADVLAIKEEISREERRDYAERISAAAGEIRALLESVEI